MDLSLNNLHCFICHKTKPNQIKPIGVHALPMRMLTLLSVDEILLPWSMNWSPDFRGLPFNEEIAPSWLKQMNPSHYLVPLIFPDLSFSPRRKFLGYFWSICTQQPELWHAWKKCWLFKASEFRKHPGSDGAKSAINRGCETSVPVSCCLFATKLYTFHTLSTRN